MCLGASLAIFAIRGDCEHRKSYFCENRQTTPAFEWQK
jgi:hypothetical protein